MTSSIDIQIRFSDIDLMGHVNNAIYLNYFESARMQCLVSMLGKWDWYANGIILKTNEIEYIAPVFLEDKAKVTVSVEHLGQKSFTLGYALHVNGELKTKGRSVLVSFNFKENRTQELHPDFRAALEKMEN
ncbi:MAG: hypothetical protein K0R65_2206 [Crocinitomicaceae bacterium]|jgi:acyl-CoA thioester hydrolase|nr:hypothetical protein [Crocinitomicaceae bacterium]